MLKTKKFLLNVLFIKSRKLDAWDFLGKYRISSKSKSGTLRHQVHQYRQQNKSLQKKLSEHEDTLAALKETNKELEHKVIKLDDHVEWLKAQLKFEREEKKQLEMRLTRKERRKRQLKSVKDLSQDIAQKQDLIEKLDKKKKRAASELQMLEDLKEKNILGSATLVLVDLPNIQTTAKRVHNQFFSMEQILRASLKYSNPRVFLFTTPVQPFFSKIKGSFKGDNRIQVRRVTQVKERGQGNGAIKYQDVDATLVMIGTQQVDTRSYRKLVLFSGDGDFLPLVELAKANGLKVTVVGVEGTVASLYRDVARKVKYIAPLRI